MLTQIREKFAGGIALVILALIGISFVFFGINYDFIGSNFAAKVEGSEIGVAQFENAYRQQLQQNPTLNQLPPEFRVQVRQRILDLLVRERLVDLYLAEEGYQISDDLVTRSIQQIPEFQIDGKFDKDTYYNVLLQNSYEPAQFEAAQRRAMRADQLQRAIGATALVTPSDYRRYLNLIAEQRLVEIANFDVDNFVDGVEVTDAMVEDYYANNESLFQQPEKVDIEFIEVRRDELAQDVEVSEAALQAYYEDSRDRYLQDEQRQARHILILFDDDEAAAEESAKALAARANAGEPFEDLARQYSKDGGTAAQGGDLGALTRTQLAGELGSAIFAMNEGEIDGPIKSEFGYHIVRLDKILEQGPLPLDQVRGELLNELREREAEAAFRNVVRNLSDAVFDHTDMQVIADAAGLPLKSATDYTRAGGEPFGSNQLAIDAVFADSVLIDGNVSEVVELDANRSAVFKVTAHTPAARLPLEEVREEIVDSIRTLQAEGIVFERAGNLLQAMETGADFAEAAEAAGATVSEPKLVGRQDPSVERSVLAQVFLAEKPAQNAPVFGQVPESDGSVTVFSLQAVLPGRPESIPLADRDAGKTQLAQQAGGADYTAFVQALYEDADVVFNEDVLAASDLLQ